MRSFLLLGAICLSVPVMALGRPVSDNQQGPVLVIVPPWIDARHLVIHAGGQIVGFDQALFGILATSDTPNFHQAVLDAGAWAVRDGTLLAGLC